MASANVGGGGNQVFEPRTQSPHTSRLLPPENFPDPVFEPGQIIGDGYLVDRDGRVDTVPRTVLLAESGRSWVFIRSIRKCIYGKVRQGVEVIRRDDGRYLVTEKIVAIKCMEKEKIAQGRRRRMLEDPMKEISSMQYLSSPGNVHVLQLTACVEDHGNVYTVMPFCDGGELFTFVKNQGATITEDIARVIFRQIAEGTKYLQQKGVCHRDMSLENLLVTNRSTVVIIDMGMCLKVPLTTIEQPPGSSGGGGGQKVVPVLMPPQGQCGKRNYMSPEVYLNQAPFDGFKIDIWALGIILFIILTKIPPWEIASYTDPRYAYVMENGLAGLLQQWNLHLSPGSVELMDRMLQEKPSERFDLDQVMGHPWYVGPAPTAAAPTGAAAAGAGGGNPAVGSQGQSAGQAQGQPRAQVQVQGQGQGQQVYAQQPQQQQQPPQQQQQYYQQQQPPPQQQQQYHHQVQVPVNMHTAPAAIGGDGSSGSGYTTMNNNNTSTSTSSYGSGYTGDISGSGSGSIGVSTGPGGVGGGMAGLVGGAPMAQGQAQVQPPPPPDGSNEVGHSRSL